MIDDLSDISAGALMNTLASEPGLPEGPERRVLRGPWIIRLEVRTGFGKILAKFGLRSEINSENLGVFQA